MVLLQAATMHHAGHYLPPGLLWNGRKDLLPSAMASAYGCGR